MSSNQRPIVVCALEFERAILARKGLGRIADLQCCGPGPDHVRAWAARTEPGKQPVILCGAAGALNERMAHGSAHVISEVVDGLTGRRYRPMSIAAEACVIVSVPHIVTRPEEKANIARAFQADLVDLESAALAEVAQQRGWLWMIVRGVSDGASEALPSGVADWVDDLGRARVSAILLELLRRPALARNLMRLRTHSSAAMDRAGNLIESYLRSRNPATEREGESSGKRGI
jgi:adenosylhomocysteine nucleosidase